MSEVKIVVLDGVRYREEDAKRRGLLEEKAPAKAEPDEDKPTEAADAEKPADAQKTRQPANKGANPATK